MEIKPESFCPACKAAIPVAANFCPICGKQLKPDTRFFKKVIVYSVSLFLPPFGLWYAVKYLKQGDYESRKIGIISIILTIISIMVMIWITAGIISSLSQAFSAINSLNI
jgi:predicted nucleic acid-binding Zn ribbon protein